jgi:peroxiredoxin
MAQLRHDYQKFITSGAEVIAVGPEAAVPFTRWWHQHEMPFVGIPDPHHTIAGLYGQKLKFLKGGRMPALVVIDRQSRIRLMHYADSMSDIPANELILTIIAEINTEPITVA